MEGNEEPRENQDRQEQQVPSGPVPRWTLGRPGHPCFFRNDKEADNRNAQDAGNGDLVEVQSTHKNEGGESPVPDKGDDQGTQGDPNQEKFEAGTEKGFLEIEEKQGLPEGKEHLRNSVHPPFTRVGLSSGDFFFAGPGPPREKDRF